MGDPRHGPTGARAPCWTDPGFSYNASTPEITIYCGDLEQKLWPIHLLDQFHFLSLKFYFNNTFIFFLLRRWTFSFSHIEFHLLDKVQYRGLKCKKEIFFIPNPISIDCSPACVSLKRKLQNLQKQKIEVINKIGLSPSPTFCFNRY